MALDFHRLDNNQYLFGLDDRKLDNLAVIFEAYQQRTGIFIDPYSDMQLTTDNQRTLIKIIDDYINKTNLNNDKQKTIDIIEFRGLLTFFANANCDLRLLGD